MYLVKIMTLYVITAIAEITGCYLAYLYLRMGKSAWLLVPALASLAIFAWLLTLHPTASGRVYAAYGGVYILVAMCWLRLVDGIKLSVYDWTGAGISILGMLIIVIGWQHRT
jgi:small multidrug resistance family-3 protein